MPPFQFAFDPMIDAVCVILTGQWSMTTADAYMQAVVDNIRSAPGTARPRKALFDLRNCALHSRDVAEALAEFHARVTPDMDRVALVVASTLDGMQAKRIGKAREVQTFDTVAAARDWLCGG